MNLRRGILSFLAVLGLLVGVQLLCNQATALEEKDSGEDTEVISVRNPLVDCSTSPALNNKFLAAAIRAGGGHSGVQRQQCNACHRSSSPRVNTGDKPVARQGSAMIHNRLASSMTYEYRFGNKGEWKEVTLRRGEVGRHSWKYSRANQNRSPELYVRYKNSDGKQVQTRLTLLATPNAKIGSVYFFDLDDKDSQEYLWTPSQTLARKNR